jgi:hypothetical protein
MKYSEIILLALLFSPIVFSCNESAENGNLSTQIKHEHPNETQPKLSDTDDFDYSDNLFYFVYERVPNWLIESGVLSENKLMGKYEIDIRLNPFYLEEDFNGDEVLDIALPIKEIKTGKIGFAIVHGGSFEVHLVGAGKHISNALSDDMNYINIWKINRLRENSGTDIDEYGDLIETPILYLNHASISIAASEVGGGIIFWNGKEYEYLHQTC